MTIKWNIKDNSFNIETGISTITIATDLGFFQGTAKLHDEDRDIVSEFFGCRLAEARAAIKYIKQKNSILKYEINSLNRYFNNIKKIKYYNEKEKQVKMLQNELNDLHNKYNNNQMAIQKIKENINWNINNYRKDCEAFKKAIEKKKEPTEK